VAMRGDDRIYRSLFSYIDLEKRVRADHPLRAIRQIANAALKSLSGEFAKLHSPIGRESIPPERLMRALLLQAFYPIRSEQQLVERIDYDLLFRWFVGLGIDTRCGTPRVLPRTPIACEPARWQASSSPQCCRKTQSCRASTSRSMARCSKPGRARRASARRTVLTSRRTRTQWRGRLPWRARPERHARLDHRPRRLSLPQRAGQGSAAVFHRPRADGETATAWSSAR
jgi:hypothetical protein